MKWLASVCVVVSSICGFVFGNLVGTIFFAGFGIFTVLVIIDMNITELRGELKKNEYRRNNRMGN